MTDIKISRIENRAEFLARWTAFFQQAEHPSFFLSPVWMQAWLDQIIASAPVYEVVALDNGISMAMGVFGVGDRWGGVGLKEVRFYETGDQLLDAIYLEYADFLIKPEAVSSVRTEMLGAVIEKFSGVDTFVFRNARDPLTNAINAFAAGAPTEAKTLLEQPVYEVDLARFRAADEEFLTTLSSSLRAKIRRAMRGYEKIGTLATSVINGASNNWDTTWKKLKLLHQARWHSSGQSGAFDNPRFLAFHKSLRQISPQYCQLFEVLAGNETIGVLYNFTFNNRVINYQSGFREETDNKLTPGFISHALACQYYMEQGFKTYDLLAGEADYKSRLGKKTECLTSIAIERPTARIKLRNVLKKLRP